MTFLSLLFGLSLTIQCLFWGIIFGRFAFFYTSKSTKKAQCRGVSLIICARNEATNLRQFLPLWLSQNYPNYEVIVVDDRSEDQTPEILQQFAEKYPHFRFLTIDQKPINFNGKKYALEQGIKSTQHDIILLTDADCYPVSPENIRLRAEAFHDQTEVILGYSPYKFTSNFLNFVIQYETLYTAIQYFSLAFWGHPYMGVGRNLGYSRQLFYQKNGFDKYKAIIGGDDDLFINQNATAENTRLVIDSESQIISIPEQTWQAWFQQKKRHLSVGKFYRWQHKLILGSLTLSQLGFWFLFWLIFFSQENLIFFWISFLTRQSIMFLVFKRIHNRLQSSLPLRFVFIFDFLYLFYYTFTGFISLISKKTAWKEENDSSRIKH